VITLGPAEEIPDRPFSALDRGWADLEVMDRMLARLRRHVVEVSGEAAFGSRIDRFADPGDGGDHKIVLTDIAAARTGGDLVVVGFFGQARGDVDHRPIVDLEESLIADMAEAVNPLVYYNVHWAGAGWGNLVLFADQQAKAGWGHDPRHATAVARSPLHYHSIRLHNGTLPGGLPGGRRIELVRTRYFDFSGPIAWKAVRDYA
jgi:hypothetical protein